MVSSGDVFGGVEFLPEEMAAAVSSSLMMSGSGAAGQVEVRVGPSPENGFRVGFQFDC